MEDNMAVELTGGSFLSTFIEVLLEKLVSRELRDLSREQKFIDRSLKDCYIVLQTIYGVLDDAEYRQTTDRAVKNWVDELKGAVYDADDLLDAIVMKALRCKIEAESQAKIEKVRNFLFFTAACDRFKSKSESVTVRLVYLARQKIALGLKKSLSGENVLSKRNPKRALIEEFGKEIVQPKALPELEEFGKEIVQPKELPELDEIGKEIALIFQLKKLQKLEEITHQCGGRPAVNFLRGSRCNITELRLGMLTNLRYLDLSGTKIERIPEPVSTLYNLQTLALSNCRSLTTLPKNMGNLVNLRHLNIGGTALEDMPTQMGRLTSLRMLSDFIVGKHSGSRMYELGGLLNLRGTLRISNLQNVVDPADAMASNLKTMKFLDSLVLEWSGDSDDHSPENESEVFEILQPHRNLERLTIRYYGGRRFPNWLGESSFANMVFLHLNECKLCMSLPSLGLLPSLKDLIIEGISEVKVVGPEFYGSTMKPFRSLETLIFVGMEDWVEWISFEPEREDFPRLQVLCIQRCPNLRKALPHYLPSLTRLEISECQKLEASLPRTPVILELQLHWNNKVLFRIDDEITSKFSSHMPRITNEAASFSIPYITHEAASNSSLPVTETSEITNVAASKSPLHKTEIPNITHEAASKSSLRLTEISEITNEAASKPTSHKTEIPHITHESASKSSLHATEISDTTNEAASQSSSHVTEIPNIRHGVASQSLNDRLMSCYSQDILKYPSSSESLKISDSSQLKDLPPGLHSLRIEECNGLESLPEEMMGINPCFEHLYIISCSSLKSFPRGGLPSTLKTLYIRNCRKLEFSLLENTVHQYALLERLCIGSSCDSLTFLPLGFFPKLRSLCISDCANLESISILEGLYDNLRSLDAMEIRDCPTLVSFPKGGLPAPNLTSFFISNCKNLKSLPERFNTLQSLRVLSISKCPSLVSLPEGDLPYSLNFLCITSCNKLTPRKEWGMHRMSSLSRFEIEGGCSSMRSFPEEGLLPASLTSLCISRLLNLKCLDHNGLRCLTSLETLEINFCNKLRSFPEEGLPNSLSSLIIKDCSLLKIRCQRDTGVDWTSIAHIPHIEIDEEVLS